MGKCPFCNIDRADKTNEENVEDVRKRAEANDAGAMYVLASYYRLGRGGLQQDWAKAMEVYARSAELGCNNSHYTLGAIYDEGGDLKKAKFHHEAAAMAGHELSRFNIGCIENISGNQERAVKHFTIAASGGHYGAMAALIARFRKGDVSRESIDSTLAAYNKSCAEMRSEARDAHIRAIIDISIYNRNSIN
jgi:TPR repeat protein